MAFDLRFEKYNTFGSNKHTIGDRRKGLSKSIEVKRWWSSRAFHLGISAGDLAVINLELVFLDSARYVEPVRGINFKVRRC